MPPLFPGGSRWWMSGTSPILVPRRVGNCSRFIIFHQWPSQELNLEVPNISYMIYPYIYRAVVRYPEPNNSHLFQPEHLFRYRSWWINGVSQARPTPKLCSNSWVCARQGSLEDVWKSTGSRLYHWRGQYPKSSKIKPYSIGRFGKYSRHRLNPLSWKLLER